MEKWNLSNIITYDDFNTDNDIIKKIIEDDDQEDAFYLFDVEDVVKKHKKWIEKMPKVTPYFALKSNPDPIVINIIAAFGGKFDCASKQEIETILEKDISPDSIIFANPIKALSHIKYAKKVGVEKTTVDTKEEVIKIKNIYPEAKLVIRIAIDGSASSCGINFSRKFGCEPTNEAIELIKFIKSREMSLIGFSFHLGSPCFDTNAFGRGVTTCYELIKIAETIGFTKCKIIDIGGGISGIDNNSFEEVAVSVNKAIENVDSSIEIIAEPGRYYVETAFTLVACVQGKKLIKEGDIVKRFYYINEGGFGSFIEELLNIRQKLPIPLYKKNNKKYMSVIWGQTCDPYDCVIQGSQLPDFEIGDWLTWKNMGAYGRSNATHFNGYPPSPVFPIMRKTAWKNLSTELQHNQNNHV